MLFIDNDAVVNSEIQYDNTSSFSKRKITRIPVFGLVLERQLAKISGNMSNGKGKVCIMLSVTSSNSDLI